MYKAKVYDYRDMGLPEAAIEFLRYLDVVQNKSSLTVQEYAFDLRTFFRFIKRDRREVLPDTPDEEIIIKDIDVKYLKTITLQDAYSFLAYCKNDRNNSAKTRSRKATSLKIFFKYLTVQMKILDEDPMRELDRPKNSKTIPKYLTLEQCLSLLDHVDGKYKERDYCILTIFLNCGLRLSELVGIDLSDIVYTENGAILTVTGKGSKQRNVYLNNACQDAVKAYLKVRPADNVKDRNALFLSRHLQRISPKTVQHIVYSCLEKAGLSEYKFSVHKLRHTAATLMYQHGNVDMLALKNILGHENLNTTEIYTHISDEQLHKAIDSNPLSNVKRKNNNSTNE